MLPVTSNKKKKKKLTSNFPPDIGIESSPAEAMFLVGGEASLSCTLKNPTTLTAQPSIAWILVGDTESDVSSDNVNFDGANPTGTSTLTFST